MKIATFGFRGPTDQISRIEDGFRALNNEIVENNPDILYSNNGLYNDVLEISKKYPRAKKIFTLLDIPFHVSNYPFNQLIDQLKQADAICTISQTVKNQLLDKFGLGSTVIYQPVKPVNYQIGRGLPKFLFLYVGRAGDTNKRFEIVKDFILKNNFKESDLMVAGPENPYFGNYLGIVEDSHLNFLYNECGYVFLPSAYEGLGLPIFESIICRKPVIVCNDNPTAREFLGNLCCEPNSKSIFEKINSIEWQISFKDFIEKNSEKFKKQFDPIKIASNIIEVYNKL